MRARRFIRPLMPPVLIALARGRPLFPNREFVWQGVYTRFQDIPSKYDTYDDDIEVSKHVGWTSDALESVRAGEKPNLWHETLGLVAAIISSATGRVRVLEFGGAVRSGYVQLLGTLPD